MHRFTLLPRILPAVAILAVVLGAPALASEGETVLPVDEVEWTSGPPTLPEGAELAVVAGHPTEDGPFVIRLRFPPDYEVPAHWHSKAENLTIIEGTFNFGTGEVLDREASTTLPAGSFVHIPAETRHFAWTDDGVVVQIHGEGPFDVHYVDPENDPREQAAQDQ